jgi:RNA polymerase sigma factor (TIGR02999 family)
MGGRSEFESTFADLYQEVRVVAHRALRAGAAPWGRGATLGTTALVHEAFLKLRAGPNLGWQDDSHFLALVSRAMRFVLVDYARARSSAKRGGGATALPLDESNAMSAAMAEDVLALDDALDRLAERKPRLARVVECRFLVGLDLEETAQALGVSTMTVKRDWVAAKAFLARELAGAPAVHGLGEGGGA